MEDSLSPEVGALLRCPLTNQSLHFLSPKELAGYEVELSEGGWVTEDKSRVYPVRDGFPILVADESVELALPDAD
ncbi:MAG: hypothetical protein AAF733_02675 [Verrucomicrobiota bacterium]